ncbi:hypothetical protein GC163_16980 [bacterium]|nr:hypothetical protein [bacterium]
MRRIAVAVILLSLIGMACWWGWQHFTSQSAQSRYTAATASQNWSAAQEAAEKWADLEPESVDAWLAVAEACRRNGQFALTADALGRLPDDDPRTLTSLALRGDLLLSELRQPQAAIENWQRMLRIAPHANLAHQRLIYVYAMLLKRSLLQQQIYAAIENHSEPPEAYVYLCALQGLQFSDGLIKCYDWLRACPDDRNLEIAVAVYAARSTPSRTQAMFGLKGVVPGDMSLIRTCREKYPDSLEVLSVFVDLAIYDGDVDEVARLLADVEDSANVDSRFCRYHGWVELNRKQPKAAVEWGQKAIAINPLDWKSRHLLSDAERLAGFAEDAARNSELAARGKILERRCLELPNGSAASDELLEDILQYGRDCGDNWVERGLTERLTPTRSRNTYNSLPE